MLQQFIDLMDVGVGELTALVLRFWAWMVVRLVSLPAFPNHHYLGKLSSTALVISLSATCRKEEDQFS